MNKKRINSYFKYIIPFLLSLLVFTLQGYYPTDCSNPATGAECSTVSPSDKPDSCYFQDIPLHGRVQFVEAFPDIRIQIVDAFPDINVKLVDAFPDECGEWQVVEAFPDFRVQVVNAFPDIKVKFVDAFPGME